jgi:hypothetical protein
MDDDFYARLKVNEAASSQEIKKAHNKLARELHTDVNSDGDEERLKKINEAYDTLGNPDRRKAYDKSRKVLAQARERQERARAERERRRRSQSDAKVFGDRMRGHAGSAAPHAPPPRSSPPPRQPSTGPQQRTGPSAATPTPQPAPVRQPTPVSVPYPHAGATTATPQQESNRGCLLLVVGALAAIALLVVLISKPGSTTPATTPQSYAINLNYKQSLASMMRAAHVSQDRNQPRLTDSPSAPTHGPATVSVKLLHLTSGLKVNPDVAAGIGEDPNEYRQWLRILDQRGYRPATLRELLAFRSQHLNVRRSADVVELGSLSPTPIGFEPGLAYVGVSRNNLEVHSTGDDGFDELGYRYVFLVVPK